LRGRKIPTTTNKRRFLSPHRKGRCGGRNAKKKEKSVERKGKKDETFTKTEWRFLPLHGEII